MNKVGYYSTELKEGYYLSALKKFINDDSSLKSGVPLSSWPLTAGLLLNAVINDFLLVPNLVTLLSANRK